MSFMGRHLPIATRVDFVTDLRTWNRVLKALKEVADGHLRCCLYLDPCDYKNFFTGIYMKRKQLINILIKNGKGMHMRHN